MFEHVTYNFYSDTMGRAVIPDETAFNRHKTEAIVFVKTKLPFISPAEDDGISKSTCMITEELYKADKNKTADGRIETSRSIEGFSQSFDVSKVQTLYERQMFWLRAFCTVSTGLI